MKRRSILRQLAAVVPYLQAHHYDTLDLIVASRLYRTDRDGALIIEAVSE